ncbi:hypothetical protein CANCADRAFT_31508 [Tortispora caseinolytica NRRL Y-17796]|uniref:Serine/threonine-protein phosphatase n=1 Tax=Tortispora caseinolytica NRRL Y-17796 TaxID=767744 RepID=A0A1E4TFY2_9ASCO|nr:hypothetical protein CANCADRAFT_31508 [Tortispora caseinolytica NRRL Y-17796]
MGSSSSKESLKSYPSFSRSDTQTSVKSNKSNKSTKSTKSTRSVKSRFLSSHSRTPSGSGPSLTQPPIGIHGTVGSPILQQVSAYSSSPPRVAPLIAAPPREKAAPKSANNEDIPSDSEEVGVGAAAAALAVLSTADASTTATTSQGPEAYSPTQDYFSQKPGKQTNPETPGSYGGDNTSDAASPLDSPALTNSRQMRSLSPRRGLHEKSRTRSMSPQRSTSPSLSPYGSGRLLGSSSYGSSSSPFNSRSLGLSLPGSNSLDLDEIISRLLDNGISGKVSKTICLKQSEITQICARAREVFLSQPTLIELSAPVKIVGDVHGQYNDLLRMFKLCGFPPSSNYLFLGDYVDRGKQGLETILLLLCYKIKFPENFFLLRGNHECANVTRVYGFYDECKRRSSLKTWRTFIDTFNTLPIAAVVASKIFCVHGGLSPELSSMTQIRSIERPSDVPDSGLLNDLLWSDPAYTTAEWEDNERGVSYCFGKTAINKFLTRFGFDLVCRAHMVVEDGYEFFNDRSLVTVFSAPNYCGEFDNWGAVMAVSEELLCSFQLLKPLDSVAIKQEMRRWRQNGVLASPPATTASESY